MANSGHIENRFWALYQRHIVRLT